MANSRIINMLGQKYGKLLITAYVGAGTWKCLCECGEESIMSGANIRRRRKDPQCNKCTKKAADTYRLLDLAGKKFNMWSVVKYVGKSKWECICDCGRICNVSGKYLKNGKSKSCKSCRGDVSEYLSSGSKVGKVTLIYLQLKTIRKTRYWYCLCDCGKKESISEYRLKRSVRVSCRSCSPNIKRVDNAAFNKLLFSYQKAARNRGIEWGLSVEEFMMLTSGNCHYTGLPPSSLSKTQISEYKYNGVDRVDNSKGYYLDNCVSCNSTINKMKLNLDYSVFIETCALITKHISEKVILSNKNNNLKAV